MVGYIILFLLSCSYSLESSTPSLTDKRALVSHVVEGDHVFLTVDDLSPMARDMTGSYLTKRHRGEQVGARKKNITFKIPYEGNPSFCIENILSGLNAEVVPKYNGVISRVAQERGFSPRLLAAFGYDVRGGATPSGRRSSIKEALSRLSGRITSATAAPAPSPPVLPGALAFGSGGGSGSGGSSARVAGDSLPPALPAGVAAAVAAAGGSGGGSAGQSAVPGHVTPPQGTPSGRVPGSAFSSPVKRPTPERAARAAGVVSSPQRGAAPGGPLVGQDGALPVGRDLGRLAELSRGVQQAIQAEPVGEVLGSRAAEGVPDDSSGSRKRRRLESFGGSRTYRSAGLPAPSSAVAAAAAAAAVGLPAAHSAADDRFAQAAALPPLAPGDDMGTGLGGGAGSGGAAALSPSQEVAGFMGGSGRSSTGSGRTSSAAAAPAVAVPAPTGETEEDSAEAAAAVQQTREERLWGIAYNGKAKPFSHKGKTVRWKKLSNGKIQLQQRDHKGKYKKAPTLAEIAQSQRMFGWSK